MRNRKRRGCSVPQFVGPRWISASHCRPDGSLAASLPGRRSAHLPATDIARALRRARAYPYLDHRPVTAT
ncbi:hypothetical protein IB62_015470 [Xanthomonas euvesicatoria]|nr:hypothetical protein IB62_015470 [Xanthomonas euvesicatoria]